MTPKQIELCQKFLKKYSFPLEKNIANPLIPAIEKIKLKIEKISGIEKLETYAEETLAEEMDDAKNLKQIDKVHGFLEYILDEYDTILDYFLPEHQTKLDAFIHKLLLVNAYMWIYKNKSKVEHDASITEADQAHAELLGQPATAVLQNTFESPYVNFMINTVRNRGKEVLHFDRIPGPFIQTMKHVLTQCHNELKPLLTRTPANGIGVVNEAMFSMQMQEAVTNTMRYLSLGMNSAKLLAINSALILIWSLIQVLNFYKNEPHDSTFNATLCDFVIAAIDITISLKLKISQTKHSALDQSVETFIQTTCHNFQPVHESAVRENNYHKKNSSARNSNASVSSSSTNGSSNLIIITEAAEDYPKWMDIAATDTAEEYPKRMDAFARHSTQYDRSKCPSVKLRESATKVHVEAIFDIKLRDAVAVASPSEPSSSHSPATATQLPKFFKPKTKTESGLNNFFKSLYAEWEKIDSGASDRFNKKTEALKNELCHAANPWMNTQEYNRYSPEQKIEKVLAAVTDWLEEEYNSSARRFFLGTSQRNLWVGELLIKLSDKLCLIRDPQGTRMKFVLKEIKEGVTCKTDEEKKQLTPGAKEFAAALNTFDIDKETPESCLIKLKAIQQNASRHRDAFSFSRSSEAQKSYEFFGRPYFWMEKDESEENIFTKKMAH